MQFGAARGRVDRESQEPDGEGDQQVVDKSQLGLGPFLQAREGSLFHIPRWRLVSCYSRWRARVRLRALVNGGLPHRDLLTITVTQQQKVWTRPKTTANKAVFAPATPIGASR